ncbi:hypothetical protein, partial [Salmonella enterica]|uniref:hypothetical protein n=1 Tax=Salmonella enterica TaxID=28901 RepID=UPI001F3A859E
PPVLNRASRRICTCLTPRPASRLPSMVKTLARYGYVPLMLVGINGVAIPVARTPWAGLWMVALITAAIGLSFAVERALPYDQEWHD